MHKLWMVVLVVMLVVVAPTIAQDAEPDTTPRLLSAYFGLDNALPRAANRACRGAFGADGMPVIFSHPVDMGTLEAGDFAVITEGGAVYTPRCVTLGPAADVGEMRTALLIGEFGDAVDDPPLTVEIVSEVLSGSGDPGTPQAANLANALNFFGASVAVTPLDAGPFLVDAEVIPEVDWVLDVRGRQGQGSGCPVDGLVQIVRVKWAGGVSKPGGDEVDDVEREAYTVTVLGADGTESDVTPFALGDLNDGDNNHHLCLDVAGEALSVTFAAGYLTDPNEDALNPEMTVAVQG